jgi:hypothetical protein
VVVVERSERRVAKEPRGKEVQGRYGKTGESGWQMGGIWGGSNMYCRPYLDGVQVTKERKEKIKKKVDTQSAAALEERGFWASGLLGFWASGRLLEEPSKVSNPAERGFQGKKQLCATAPPQARNSLLAPAGSRVRLAGLSLLH